MESKYINRYYSFCKSLNNLEMSKSANPGADFVLAATVQNFNLTFDISWKVMKDILTKYMGISSFASGSPREVLQTAYSNNIISDDDWIKMLKCRNQLAHDYDGKYAMQVFEQIVNNYINLFEQFKEHCTKYYADGNIKDMDSFRT